MIEIYIQEKFYDILKIECFEIKFIKTSSSVINSQNKNRKYREKIVKDILQHKRRYYGKMKWIHQN